MNRHSGTRCILALSGFFLGTAITYILTSKSITCEWYLRRQHTSFGVAQDDSESDQIHQQPTAQPTILRLCSSSLNASSNQSADIDEGIPEVALWQRAAPITDLQRKTATGEGLVVPLYGNGTSSFPRTIWQYRGTDPTHLGLISFSTDHEKDYQPLTMHMLQQVRITWRYGPVNVNIHTASKSSPVVDDATVYVGADNERLYAVDRRTGELKWRFFTRPAKHGIHGTPAVDQQYVFIGDYAGWGYALNKSSGVLVWEVKLGQSIGASPVVVGDRVYWAVEVDSPSANGYLAVVERCTGHVLFYSSPLGDHTHCTPTVLIRKNSKTEARVYLGANTGRFHCLNANNGNQIWQFETFGRRARSIFVDLKMPQHTSMATIAHAVCQQDEELCFMSEAALLNKGEIKGTATVFDDRVVFGSWDHHIYCLNATNGLLLWTFMSTDLVMSSAAIDPRERRVFIGSHSGILVALSLDAGQLLWSLQTSGRLMSSPILVLMAFHEQCTKGLILIIGGFDQSLFVICAQNGHILWKRSLVAGYISNEIAFDSSNSFYVSTNSGHLIKLN